MSSAKRYMHECQSEGCWNFCVTTQRDPAPWTCPACEDDALRDHLNYLEALSTRHDKRPLTQQETHA